MAKRVQPLYATWMADWPISAEYMSAAFDRHREALQRAGLQLANARHRHQPAQLADFLEEPEDAPEAPQPARRALRAPRRQSQRQAAPNDGKATAKDIEDMRQDLGWRLASDGRITRAEVRQRLRTFGPLWRQQLRDWLYGRAKELAAYVPTQDQNVLLQFAALGPAWFDLLREDPSVADYLGTEAQNIDLEELLDTLLNEDLLDEELLSEELLDEA